MSVADAEPVSLATFLLALADVLGQFHVYTITADQAHSLNVFLVVLAGLFIRSKVTPVAKADKQAADHLAFGKLLGESERRPLRAKERP